MLNVAVINGGRGAGTLIPALLDQPDLQVTSIVNAYDDGKSTGEIRRFFGMLGPSDIRKVQELMLPKSDPDYDANKHLFRHRFAIDISAAEACSKINEFIVGNSLDIVGAKLESHETKAAIKILLKEFTGSLAIIEKLNGKEFNFSDCSIMNCIYAGAFIYFKRDIEKASRFIDKLFRLKGSVIATSNENKYLVALRENGEVLYSESEIVELRSNVRIDRIYLLDSLLKKEHFERLTLEEKSYYLQKHHCSVPVCPSVKLALQEADIIIYAAGTQHSSLYPSYLSTGLAEAVADNKIATKVFITNIGADYETPMYKASDYISRAHRYLELSGDRKYSMEELFSVNLINISKLKANETYVEYDEVGFSNINTKKILDAYESKEYPGKHDGNKLVKEILCQYYNYCLLN